MTPKQSQQSHEPIVVTPQSSHCVIYRTGGTANFKWHRTAAMSRAAALEASRESARMGYPCHVERYAESVAIGLPQTFAPGFPADTEWS